MQKLDCPMLGFDANTQCDVQEIHGRNFFSVQGYLSPNESTAWILRFPVLFLTRIKSTVRGCLIGRVPAPSPCELTLYVLRIPAATTRAFVCANAHREGAERCGSVSQATLPTVSRAALSSLWFPQLTAPDK